jgi:hypothetical protein
MEPKERVEYFKKKKEKKKLNGLNRSCQVTHERGRVVSCLELQPVN